MCNDIPECDLFVYFPIAKLLSEANGTWGTSGLLKTARNPVQIHTSQLMCALRAPAACLSSLLCKVSFQSSCFLLSLASA